MKENNKGAVKSKDNSNKEVSKFTLIVKKISNLILNKSKLDLYAKKQMTLQHKKYSLGKELYATIDKGNPYLLFNNSTIISKHPLKKDIKLISIADGDFSNNNSMSIYVLKKVQKWFDNLNIEQLNNMDELKKSLETLIEKLNDDLTYNYKACSSLAVAVVGKDNSLITTIGNARIYFIKSNKIIGETRDDTYIERLCDLNLADKNRKRFHKARYIIDYRIGDIKDKSIISRNTKIVENDYDKLLILNNGITKLVDNNKIEKILSESENKNITDRLISTAKTEDIYLDTKDIWCDKKIEAGKSNTSAAVYIKRR